MHHWKTNKGFEKFWKQVQLMTNPKLKHLKEGMVEATASTKAQQVIYTHTRYHLFCLCRMANLKGGKGLPSLSLLLLQTA
jgi:hypothetical protein